MSKTLYNANHIVSIKSNDLVQSNYTYKKEIIIPIIGSLYITLRKGGYYQHGYFISKELPNDELILLDGIVYKKHMVLIRYVDGTMSLHYFKDKKASNNFVDNVKRKSGVVFNWVED